MSSCCSCSLNWYERFIVKRDYLRPILQYADAHSTEDSAIMSAIFHLIQVCMTSGQSDLNAYMQTRVEECDRLKGLPIVAKLMSAKKRSGEECLEKTKSLCLGYS